MCSVKCPADSANPERLESFVSFPSVMPMTHAPESGADFWCVCHANLGPENGVRVTEIIKLYAVLLFVCLFNIFSHAYFRRATRYTTSWTLSMSMSMSNVNLYSAFS